MRKFLKNTKKKRSFKSAVVLSPLAVAALFAFSGCAGKKARSLDAFASAQQSKIVEGTAFEEGEFNFWAAAYEPTMTDFYAFKEAWIEHGDAFPESRAMKRIQEELSKPNQRVVLVSLFMTSYEYADLTNKQLGWTIAPAPKGMINELDDEVPLRTFLPLKNQWARIFLVKYPKEDFESASRIVVSNRTARIELKRTAASQ